MTRLSPPLSFLIAACYALAAFAQPAPQNSTALAEAYWDLPLNAMRVDSLDRVFPDRPPEPAAYADPVAVPRGGTVLFQFALMADEDMLASLTVTPFVNADSLLLNERAALYKVVAVPVEANNNGGSKTAVGVEPPDAWRGSLVRVAPFDVFEVLVPSREAVLRARRYEAIAVDVKVPLNASPGPYTATLHVDTGTSSVHVPFVLEVFATVAPESPALSVSHWFWPDPEDVSYGNPPLWWSDEHWRLIENSGRVLRDFGQDTVFTPLIDGREPLIETYRLKDNSYTFDFTRFDRWAETFFALGFKTLEGHHTGGTPPMAAYGGVRVRNLVTGDVEPLLAEATSADSWLDWLPIFYKALYAHLEEKGWSSRYVQYQRDEPADPDEYQRLTALAREFLPGIRTKDAINTRPADFAPLVDVPVFSVASLAEQAPLAQQCRDKGQAVWLYHCCSPYPPCPNRHLDDPLCDSRLYPWLAFLLRADGYLYWAANNYRGADPYKTSIGPLPGGSQHPGHPPGDNWMFYPSQDGLVPSLRMAAFRDGLLDHTLLTMLAEKDGAAAEEVTGEVARSLRDYAREPGAYHAARRALLEALKTRTESIP